MTLRLPSPESSGQPPEVAQRLNALTDGAVRLTPVSLEFTREPTWDEWCALGAALAEVDRGYPWWVGDWWAHGDHGYGERAAQALDSDTWAFQTFMDAGWVARRFTTSRRREVLSFSHHKEVAALDPAEQDELLDAAERNGWSKSRLREAVRQFKRQRRLQDPGPLAVGEYRTIVADPPWRYPKGTAFDRPQSLPDAHYDTLSDEEIMGFEVEGTPVARLAPDDAAHLYLWTTQRHLVKVACKVMEAWEFEYRHTLTWCKPSLGTGAYHRSTSEFVLFGVRGNLPLREMDQGTWFAAPAVEHSAKPDEFYRIVERCCLPPYLDLFGRGGRDGWTVWGNEVDDGVRPASVGGR